MPLCTRVATRRFRVAPTVVAACTLAGIISSARAEIIWSQDFTGHTNNAYPTRDFTGNSSNDWSTVSGGDESMLRVNTSVGDPAPAVVFTDTNTNALGNFRLAMSEFVPFATSLSAPILRLRFDWKIESFSAGVTTNEAFRIILRANNSSAAGDQVVLGFNRAAITDGDASNADLAFYASSPSGSSNVNPTDANVIGLVSGIGWQPGFNFGEYDGATSSANDTDDLFYHFDASYNFVSGAFSGTITRKAADLTNGQSANFSVAMNPGLVFSDANDVILFASTNTVQGISQIDNIVIESVPEPAAGVVMLLGSLVLTGKRRRRLVSDR